MGRWRKRPEDIEASTRVRVGSRALLLMKADWTMIGSLIEGIEGIEVSEVSERSSSR